MGEAVKFGMVAFWQTVGAVAASGNGIGLIVMLADEEVLWHPLTVCVAYRVTLVITLTEFGMPNSTGVAWLPPTAAIGLYSPVKFDALYHLMAEPVAVKFPIGNPEQNVAGAGAVTVGALGVAFTVIVKGLGAP
jgi:hypothetical protein